MHKIINNTYIYIDTQQGEGRPLFKIPFKYQYIKYVIIPVGFYHQ